MSSATLPEPPANPADEFNKLTRNKLLDEMPQEQYEQVVAEALTFIENRFKALRKLVKVEQTNINPFLMLAMSSAYGIFSPLEAAEYLQNAKMPHGDATSFGKWVESKVFPIFGVTEVDEKKTDGTMYSAIDGALTVDGQNYLATWKSGPWTMNQAHATEMAGTFPRIYEVTKKPLLLGIFYGTLSQLNNKPAKVRRETGSYFHVLVGSELWEFVTGVKDAHLVVLKAIREAQAQFARAHGGKTFNEHMVEARLELSADFRTTFGLSGESDDMWESLFRHSF